MIETRAWTQLIATTCSTFCPFAHRQLLPIKQARMRKKGISVQNILQQRGTTTVRIINDLLLYTSVISDNVLQPRAIYLKLCYRLALGIDRTDERTK
jgi:hypothetical protein